MFFASDNWAGAHPAVAASLAQHAGGYASPYGTSELDKAVEQRFAELFERDIAVFFVATGTAANSLALATAAKPGGVVFAHRESHVVADECGAPEFLGGGLRLNQVPGREGKMTPDGLAGAIARYPAGSVHAGQPAAVTLTQATEIGTVYSLDEIAALAELAHASDLPVHVDGARFANAVVRLGVSPAQMTWRAGVDVLSFGGTKNGCWCAEAVVFFDPAMAAQAPFLRKRSAHLLSKSRFVAAQFAAYLHEGIWLENARHANAMAARLADVARTSNGLGLAWEPEANEVFITMHSAEADRLRTAGAVFYQWPVPVDHAGDFDAKTVLGRFVTSFATTAEDIDRFAAIAAP